MISPTYLERICPVLILILILLLLLALIYLFCSVKKKKKEKKKGHVTSLLTSHAPLTHTAQIMRNPFSCLVFIRISIQHVEFFRHDAGSHFQLVHHCTRVSLEVTHCQTASVLGMYTLSNREKLTSLEQDLLCACSLSTPLTFTRLSKLQLEKCKKREGKQLAFPSSLFLF